MRIIKDEYYNGRKVLLKALTGSYNYGTNDKTSDKDFKVFLMPTFDDLYNGNQVSFKPESKIDNNDYDFKDIRLMIKQFEKSNISYLEILASEHVSVDESFVEVWKEILKLKHDIANSNIPYLVKAMKGMCYEKRTAIIKDLPNEPTNEGFNRKLKFGFDTKQLLHIYRLFMMLCDFLDKNKVSILETVRLEDYNINYLKSIKRNKIEHDKESALQASALVIESFDRKTKEHEIFINQVRDKTCISKLEQLIKKYIGDNLNV